MTQLDTMTDRVAPFKESLNCCHMYFSVFSFFSITRHYVVKVARLARLVHSYLTR